MRKPSSNRLFLFKSCATVLVYEFASHATAARALVARPLRNPNDYVCNIHESVARMATQWNDCKITNELGVRFVQQHQQTFVKRMWYSFIKLILHFKTSSELICFVEPRRIRLFRFIYGLTDSISERDEFLSRSLFIRQSCDWHSCAGFWSRWFLLLARACRRPVSATRFEAKMRLTIREMPALDRKWVWCHACPPRRSRYSAVCTNWPKRLIPCWICTRDLRTSALSFECRCRTHWLLTLLIVQLLQRIRLFSYTICTYTVYV